MEERRRRAIHEYYRAYKAYKELDTVLAHTRVEMSGDTLIEIYRYQGPRKSERILRVTQKEEENAEVPAEVLAYERAAEQLKHMAKSRLESSEKRRWA